MFPFQEHRVSDKVRLRIFDETLSADELIWHRDAKDRTVRVIESAGWYFQFDDELPRALLSGEVLNIPQKKWHRVIRKEGSGKLIVEIVEV